MTGEMAAASSSTSVLAGNETHNRQSPGRRIAELSKLSVSFSNSPNAAQPVSRMLNSSFRNGSKSVTIFDHLLTWFQAEISRRTRLAAGVCSIFSVLTFVLTVSILQLSLWAPFGSTTDALTWFFSPANWVPILSHGICSFAVYSFLIRTFCKVDQSPRISITDTSAWLAASAVFVYMLTSTYLVFFITESNFSDGFAWVAISFGLAVSASLFVFRNDFQLTFVPIYVNSVKTLVDFAKSINVAQLVETCGIDAAIAFSFTFSFVLFMGPLFVGFNTLWLLLNIPFYFNIVVLFFIQQFFGKMFMKIVNQVIMKPVQFPFPPPFHVHSPTPEQTRVLTNVIETSDQLLKMFAIYDLRFIAWSDEGRRRDLFSLSQPGGHARNWKTCSSACTRLLDDLCNKMTTSSARLAGTSWEDHNDEDEMPRDALLMPRRMREMAFGGNGPSRFQKNIAPIRSMNTQSSFVDTILKKCNVVYAKPIVTRYEAQLNSYAAEALYMLVVDSLGEDRYGVVQKDLKELISQLCRLLSSIDTYERARAAVADKSDVTFLRMVDVSLQSSLQRVVSTFGAHIKKLNLSEENLRTIRLLCQPEDL